MIIIILYILWLKQWNISFFPQLLFKKVVPHHCLGAIWSQRDKKDGKQSSPTIRATITQFNAVTVCVVSTILRQRQIRPHLRARIIQRWIDIAQVHNPTHICTVTPPSMTLFCSRLNLSTSGSLELNQSAAL